MLPTKSLASHPFERPALRPHVATMITALVLLVGQPAEGLTINRNFLGGTAPGNAAGGGNLVSVFDAAADWWEMAILDNHVLNASFQWGPLGGNTLGQASVSAPPVPFTQATITFDNDMSSVFFIDPTPHDESEYQTFTETNNDLGGGLVNEGRVYTNPLPTSAAFNRTDLLTVAKHELGHALGLIDFPAAGVPLPNPLVITAPRPLAGTTIATTLAGGGHIDPDFHPNALMVPALPTNTRRLQSGIDILGAAEQVGFTMLNLNPIHVPEPSAMAVLVTTVLLLTARVRRSS